MTYKEAWCKIVSEISNTYDEEVKEALFMLANAAKRQDEEVEALSHLVENPYFVGFDKKDICCCKKDVSEEKLNEVKNKPVSILDKDAWNENALKQYEEMKFEEQKLK